MNNSPMFDQVFLSIGAMKAGTTWLYSVLNHHPDLHFTPEKEIHYFYSRYVDRKILDERKRLQNAKLKYLSRFDPQKADAGRVRNRLHWVSNYLSQPIDDHWYRNLFLMNRKQKWSCDFSNLNALLPAEAWPQIQANCRELRVLYTLRDPIKRLWSHTKFHMQVTGKSEEMEQWSPRQYRSFAKQSFIFRNSEYGSVLRNLKSGLQPKNMKVIFYEELHANQRTTLRQIEDFLDIQNFDYPQFSLEKRPNESSKVEMPDFFPSLFSKEVDRIKREISDLGYTIPSAWI